MRIFLGSRARRKFAWRRTCGVANVSRSVLTEEGRLFVTVRNYDPFEKIATEWYLSKEELSVIVAKAGDQLSGLVVGDKDQCLKSGIPFFFILGEDPSSLPCLSP